MASQDTNDFLHIHTVVNNQAFQERCWTSYLLAAFTVSTESIQTTASAVTAAGSAVLTFMATPANITNLIASNLSLIPPSPGAAVSPVIPNGTKVVSVTATTATLDRNVIAPGVAVGDIIRFAPIFHAERRRFAAAIFSGTVDRVLLALAILSDSTNRTNCLADKTIPGGNVTDANMNTVAVNTFTGLASMKNW